MNQNAATNKVLRKPTTRQRIWRWLIAIFLVAPPVVFLLIALLAPLDILDHWPGLARTCMGLLRTTAGFLPPWVDLLRHANSTAFPQVATLATAFAVVWWPTTTLFALVLAVAGNRPGRIQMRANRTTAQLLLIVISALPLGLIAFFGFFALPGDPSFAKGLTADSRLGYGVMGMLGMLLSVLSIAFWPIAVLAFLDSLFDRKKHD